MSRRVKEEFLSTLQSRDLRSALAIATSWSLINIACAPPLSNNLHPAPPQYNYDCVYTIRLAIVSGWFFIFDGLFVFVWFFIFSIQNGLTFLDPQTVYKSSAKLCIQVQCVRIYGHRCSGAEKHRYEPHAWSFH